MAKIIDAFLFFQELDLLEIRLEQLDPFVDLFVISEAGQTFSGKPKEFNFEKNKERFAKYLHKIHYQKIEDCHKNYQSVIKYLENSQDPSHHKVRRILELHQHYPRSEIHWVLDTYHRESLHVALDKMANQGDIVLISDLDEIPSELIFNEDHLRKMKARPHVFQQDEFRYFLNYYKDSEWLGTIGAKYEDITNYSLNGLRIDSKKERNIIDPNPIKNAGYHFTTCGGVEEIKRKIAGWGHQEFNNSAVLKNLEENINKGKDIFYRESGTNLKSISILDSKFFSPRFSKILAKYPHLISQRAIDHQDSKNFSDYLALLALNLKKVRKKLMRLL